MHSTLDPSDLSGDLLEEFDPYVGNHWNELQLTGGVKLAPPQLQQ